jgi:alpha-L-rhamnosidase
VIPDVLGPAPGEGGSAGWSEAATVIPWNAFLVYGDRGLLATQYPSMKEWVDFMHAKSGPGEIWAVGHQFGDWCFYSPDDDHAGRAAVTDKYLIAQCFYVYSTQILIKAAAALGKQEDLGRYTALLERIKQAFRHQYLTPAGLLVSNTQTAYVLALGFDLLPDSAIPIAVARLVQNITDYKYHLTTGFLGTPYICGVLNRFGRLDVAYKLLMQDSYPGWLYPVKMGATTIWERWNGIKPDSSFAPASMNSFNHYAYGAVGDFLYRVVAELDTYDDGPGYRHSRIQPCPGGELTSAVAALETVYGRLSSSWVIKKDSFYLDVEVPVNTQAEVFVPAESANQIVESGMPISNAKDIQIVGVEEGFVHLKMGSGSYHFVAKKL